MLQAAVLLATSLPWHAPLGQGSAATPAERPRLLRAVDRAESVVEGRDGPLLTVFVDPGCPFCRQAHLLTRQAVAQGRVRLQWIPVATLGEGSLRAAAWVLGAPHRADALAVLQSRSPAAVAGARLTHGRQTGFEVAAVRANTALLSLLTGGRPVTPMWVLRDARGGFRLLAGTPDGLAGWLGAAPPQPGPPRRSD
jgi:thiol:disulfide interchange protein DsbG